MIIPEALEKRIDYYSHKLDKYPNIRKLYRNCCPNTIETALEECDDDTYFVLTGDIPAMWLRDSAAQVTHYIPVSDDPEISKIIEGVIRRQLMYIEINPYANAFNKTANGNGHITDLPKQGPWVFERKYEVDSLCYPIRLLYLYWKQTGNETIIKEKLESITSIILEQWKTEQYHFEKSPYLFIRTEAHTPWETIHNEGKGNPVVYTGMTWSGFRPSDDGCQYGYLTASEMFAVVVLGYMSEMLKSVCKNETLANECETLRGQIDEGIKKFCIVEHEKYAKGIGSRHTPDNYIWHMALVMQGITSDNNEEKKEILNMIAQTDANTGYLHESFNADNPDEFTREWFTWPNSLFAEFIEKCIDENVI